jgi:hypothetical protein
MAATVAVTARLCKRVFVFFAFFWQQEMCESKACSVRAQPGIILFSPEIYGLCVPPIDHVLFATE